MELTRTPLVTGISPTVRAARIGLLAVLVLYAFLFSDAMGGPLHGINLAIHETGHFVFLPFGETMSFLGGSLFQVLLPLVFVGYFLKERDPFAAGVALWWVGLNLWDVSPYIADAQAQMLPLVGGGETRLGVPAGGMGPAQEGRRHRAGRALRGDARDRGERLDGGGEPRSGAADPERRFRSTGVETRAPVNSFSSAYN